MMLNVITLGTKSLTSATGIMAWPSDFRDNRIPMAIQQPTKLKADYFRKATTNFNTCFIPSFYIRLCLIDLVKLFHSKKKKKDLVKLIHFFVYIMEHVTTDYTWKTFFFLKHIS